MVRSPKYKQLHKQKSAQGCAGDCAELGNQDVRGKGRETNMDNSERDQPTGPNDYSILQKLPYIITALAPEYPKFVEQKMASDTDKIGDCYGDERWQKSAEEEDHGKVDQCHCTADGAETNKLENSL
jgi:hypothetical protein